MHDLLEGVLQYDVKIMLKEIIYDDNYFTMATLNSRLTNTELGYIEAKDRPTCIDSKNFTSLGHPLSQAGILYTYCVTFSYYSAVYNIMVITKLHKCGFWAVCFCW